MTRNIRMDVEYDGANYRGWQSQPGEPTLEDAIREAVEKIVNHPVTLYSSGRTDAGVHAEQHVTHFRTDSDVPEYNLLRGVNSITPRDISIYRVMEMPLEWSARHDAVEREYAYRFYNDLVPSVFWRGRSYWVRDRIDVEAMREAARHLIGRHDFDAFRSLHCDAEHAVRTLHLIEFHEDFPLIRMRVVGDAFLRHQVRITAGTLLDVGVGKLRPDEVKTILESRDRGRAGITLPGCGLTLVAVRYTGDERPSGSSSSANDFLQQRASLDRSTRFRAPGYDA
ncbi:MAG: tRNA pseudouridine(38-40) synthase TruA [bacterium]|nr:tRNA pseudouridine(38-40) synthase TruA [bacterium]